MLSLSTSTENNDTESNTSSNNNTNGHTKEATYPLPQHLQKMLSSSKDESITLKTDDIETSISNLLENSVQALDLSSASSSKNKKRKTIRMEVNEAKNEISILDLGVGMTRADLINLLGIGRELSDRCREAWTNFCQSEKDESEKEDDEMMDTEKENILYCKSDDIGGFYATLCSMGSSIKVGTKSKFDDYYDFHIEPDD